MYNMSGTETSLLAIWTYFISVIDCVDEQHIEDVQ